MTAVDSPAPAQAPALRGELLDAGVLVATPVDGLYLRSARFESVLQGVVALAHEAGASPNAPASEEMLHLPPVIPRQAFVDTDYLRSFPDLIGSIHTFTGGDAEHASLLKLADANQDWTQELEPSELMLVSATCHSIYPGMSGTLPESGRRLEVNGFSFRHEPSLDPARMQVFRQHEFVRVGTPDEALAHRDEWLDRAMTLLTGLGLPVTTEVANDPFFGRAGRMLARSQRGAELKYEIVCPVASSEKLTAITSCNYHLDHFGAPFDIRTTDGEIAHSSCIGFGLERITLALFATHGMDPNTWPTSVRDRIWPN